MIREGEIKFWTCPLIVADLITPESVPGARSVSAGGLDRVAGKLEPKPGLQGGQVTPSRPRVSTPGLERTHRPFLSCTQDLRAFVMQMATRSGEGWGAEEEEKDGEEKEEGLGRREESNPSSSSDQPPLQRHIVRETKTRARLSSQAHARLANPAGPGPAPPASLAPGHSQS